MKRSIFIAVPVAVVLAAGVLLLAAKPWAATVHASQGYELASISRGSIESIVSSSGTLAPVSEVSVLSQMSGRVEKVFADYNSHVRKGQVLSQLNTDMLKLQELQSESAVRKAQATCDLQSLDYQSKRSLFEKGLVAEYDLKSSATTLEVDAAELAAAQSALEVIQTELNQYALIISPIDGIVIDMSVEVGQSVLEGSSTNATSLFTLAEDLSKMEIKTEVDELDISSITVGQEVRFTVEADPGRSFTGTVHEIRLVPVTTDNVVTYSVMIDAANPEGRLLPGMTAEVQFITQKKNGVLMVPTAAFRFQPAGLSAQEIARLVFLADSAELPAGERLAAEKAYDEQARSQGQAARTAQPKTTGLVGMMMPGRPPRSASATAGGVAPAAGAASGQPKKSLWYLGDDGQLAVLRVTIGVNDSTNTEISGNDSLEDRKIILRVKAE